jgi:large exoprotein involved in heme utilization and adhesion
MRQTNRPGKRDNQRSAESQVAKPFRRKYLTQLIGSLLLAQASLVPAYAAPQGGSVVGGSGSIAQSGLDTTIQQNTNRLAIDWQSFNVGTDERVTFIQPSATSIALNRIVGNDASQIFGQLNANGP